MRPDSRCAPCRQLLGVYPSRYRRDASPGLFCYSRARVKLEMAAAVLLVHDQEVSQRLRQFRRHATKPATDSVGDGHQRRLGLLMVKGVCAC